MVATKKLTTKTVTVKAEKAAKAPKGKAAKAKPEVAPEPVPAPTPVAATETKPKKMSALDAAAKVLDETGERMTTKQMIETMAAQGYWTSPGGKTPAQTLYAAILREITTKGDASRFRKIMRGLFEAANR